MIFRCKNCSRLTKMLEKRDDKVAALQSDLARARSENFTLRTRLDEALKEKEEDIPHRMYQVRNVSVGELRKLPDQPYLSGLWQGGYSLQGAS